MKKKKEPVQLDDFTGGDEIQNFEKQIRTFQTGATRDTDSGKPEYAGFLSWEVMQVFGQYMHDHRIQKDGSLRASDNWKKGIPKRVYLESMFRHFVEVWTLHELLEAGTVDLGDLSEDGSDSLSDALCAMLFNVQGYLYEHLKG